MFRKLTITTAMACAGFAGAAHAAGELNIYNWGNYTSPELIAKFSEQYDVRVTVTDYDSNDTALARVRAGGSGFDLVNPSANFIPIWINEGLVEQTNVSEMENFQYVKEEWRDPPWDPGRKYSAPWLWGTGGPVVATNYYDGDINTSAIWLDPPEELHGKINVAPEMNDVLYAAIRYMGGEWCSDDRDLMRAVLDQLLHAKQYWISMEYGLDKMDTRDWYASYYWNGAAYRARRVNADVQWGFPKEGFHIFMESMMVLADAPNPENARLFQNFIMAPENAALISNFASYQNAIEGSEEFMDPDLADAPELNIPEELAHAGGWQDICSPEVNELYTRVWTQVLR
ncbi:extracellular solute-binding protein [Roseinatronobacter alkalisoli]|uniref:Extracellular solute-binding protein n=1 Tax=Roseinatronobacter alkalisoli TaxID=3028235 RepID=A0ABT5TE00_9RHOB|nr:extracellular solute-binding protein [Roseinatronobacter sp. HJB301]MDD7972935.1 extracellular solute-binding protein [Roseinatronobacter sp. HJB301]